MRFSMQVVASSCSVIFPEWLKRAFGTARSCDPSCWCADLEQRQRCDKDLLENDAKKKKNYVNNDYRSSVLATWRGAPLNPTSVIY